MGVKDIGTLVLKRLKDQAKETGLSDEMCFRLFCQEEFLRKTEASVYSENFILKGGMFLYLITKFEGRPTRGIDFMVRWISNDAENMNMIMGEICAADTGNDFIKFDVLGSDNITEERAYNCTRTKFRVHINNVEGVFSVDVSVGDVIVPRAIKRAISTRIDGFNSPSIYTYSLESAVAEKFETIIKGMEAGSRMKDFFDIYYLSEVFNFDGRKLQEAVFCTFDHRGTIYESDSFERIKNFKNNTSLIESWNHYQIGTRMEKPDFNVIIDRLEQFLEPIFHAFIMEKEWFCIWDSSVRRWLRSAIK